jgi:hypothetical protein
VDLRLWNLPAVTRECDAVGIGSAAHSGVERVDSGDLIAGELERARDQLDAFLAEREGA